MLQKLFVNGYEIVYRPGFRYESGYFWHVVDANDDFNFTGLENFSKSVKEIRKEFMELLAMEDEEEDW
jgi:hypothetical protein